MHGMESLAAMLDVKTDRISQRRKRQQLEPILKDLTPDQRLGLARRLSMMRIMARRTKAATVVA